MKRFEMKICKEQFEINGVVIGEKGNVLEITDAVPTENETLEDVLGYCDVFNVNTGITIGTTWIEVEENSLILEDV